MARILVGVTGGIAAYKACTLVRLFVREGHEVYPIVTEAAARFVAPETFFALARTSARDDPYPHLERADLLVIAPLTANTLARLAAGLADDLLTEAALAHDGPLVLAPAMNVRMWQHPATQANLETLRTRGATLVGPEEGELAEGESGPGRMAEPEQIAEAVERALVATSSLAGRSVLISAGGTREQLDAVRFLGNRSSGRMGVAVAEEARRRGAEVTLLAANLAVPAPPGVTVVETPTAADIEREALARANADIVIMAAAVADYRPAEPETGKRPKDGASWTVELAPTTDVLATLGARRGAGESAGQVLVGFAADGGSSGLERAKEKQVAKNADLIVFNDVSRSDIGFDTAENEVVLLSNGTAQYVAKAPKSRIAVAVLDEVERIIAAR